MHKKRLRQCALSPNPYELERMYDITKKSVFIPKSMTHDSLSIEWHVLSNQSILRIVKGMYHIYRRLRPMLRLQVFPIIRGYASLLYTMTPWVTPSTARVILAIARAHYKYLWAAPMGLSPCSDGPLPLCYIPSLGFIVRCVWAPTCEDPRWWH